MSNSDQNCKQQPDDINNQRLPTYPEKRSTTAPSRTIFKQPGRYFITRTVLNKLNMTSRPETHKIIKAARTSKTDQDTRRNVV